MFHSTSPTILALFSALNLAEATYLPLSRFDLRPRWDGDNSTAFISCLDAANLDPVVQGDPAYAADATPFNLRLPYSPVALVYPNCTEEVSAAVKCAAQYGVKTNPRSGGHSYASYDLGGENGHLVISLDNLRNISLDGIYATIGAGNRLGDVALGLYELGKRAMAHGTCPWVGIGGHAGHGGFGLPSRAWGILLDQVYELEVVTANGTILTANNETNSDLFWALRGAASSFGIVTTFKTITHAAPEHNTWVSYTWQNLTWQTASDYAQKWQAFAAGTTYLLGLQIHINEETAGQDSFVIDGVYYGDDGAAGANATMAPLLSQLSTPNLTTVEDQSWLDSVVLLAGNITSPSQLNTTLRPDTHDTFFATSIMVPESAPMTKNASDAFFEYLWETASQHDDELGWYVIFDLWGGEQSIITNVSDSATAFDARDTLYSIQFYGPSKNDSPPYPADGISVMKGMLTPITSNMPDVQFKGYANYVDPTLSAEEAHQYYYPNHTAELEQLKANWDPEDVFYFPQAFAPAS